MTTGGSISEKQQFDKIAHDVKRYLEHDFDLLWDLDTDVQIMDKVGSQDGGSQSSSEIAERYARHCLTQLENPAAIRLGVVIDYETYCFRARRAADLHDG